MKYVNCLLIVVECGQPYTFFMCSKKFYDKTFANCDTVLYMYCSVEGVYVFVYRL